MLLFLIPGGFSDLINQKVRIQIGKIIGIYKHARIVRKLSFSLHLNWPFSSSFGKNIIDVRCVYKLHTYFIIHIISYRYLHWMKVQSYPEEKQKKRRKYTRIYIDPVVKIQERCQRKLAKDKMQPFRYEEKQHLSESHRMVAFRVEVGNEVFQYF